MATIRSEFRVDENGNGTLLTNFEDILDWLADLPNHTKNRIAADVALEIRQLLIDSIPDAERIVTSDDG